MPNDTELLVTAIGRLTAIRDFALVQLDSLPDYIAERVPLDDREIVRLRMIARCDQLSAAITDDVDGIIRRLASNSFTNEGKE